MSLPGINIKFSHLPIVAGLLASIVVTLSACSPPAKPDKLAMAGVETIGVVSLLGEEFEANYVSHKPVYNQHFLSPPLDWKLNDRVIGLVSASLQAKGFDVVTLDYAFDGLRGVYTANQARYMARLTELYGKDTSTPALHDELLLLSYMHAVDAFILVVPGQESEFCRGGEECARYGDFGYGYHNVINKEISAYISAKLYYVPASTLQSAAGAHASAQQPLQDMKWVGAFKDYEREDLVRIRDALYEATDEAIPVAVDKMGLAMQTSGQQPGQKSDQATVQPSVQPSGSAVDESASANVETADADSPAD